MSNTTTPATSERPQGGQTSTDRLPVWRIGLTGGVVGILCCVGPAVLALLGIAVAIYVAIYVALYALTTWLGTFA